MKNCNKIKQTCGDFTYAKCTKYKGTLSEHSLLSEDDCLDIEMVAEDIYTLIDNIKEDINLDELENTCITFTEPKTPSSVITQMYSKLCELQSLVESQADLIETMQEQITNLQENNCG